MEVIRHQEIVADKPCGCLMQPYESTISQLSRQPFPFTGTFPLRLKGKGLQGVLCEFWSH
jgi:hypothetical protein